MSVGKVFEYQLRDAFKKKYPDAFVERQVDRMFGSGASVQSPPDLIVNRDGAAYLIECKATKGKSIAFDRLSAHQLTYLQKYDAIGECHHGFVACLFYNGQRGSGRVYRAWLVPISYWHDYQYRYPRKSISVGHVEMELGRFELLWVSGRGWELPVWV